MATRGIFKCKAIFLDTYANTGWSETWWTLAGQTYQKAQQSMEAYFQDRLTMDTADIEIPYLIISDIDVKGDSVVISYGDTWQGKIQIAAGVRMNPWDALLVRLNDPSNNYRGFRFFHGLSFKFFTANRQWSTVGGGPALFAKVIATLQAQNLCWQVKQKPVAIPPVYIQVPVGIGTPMRLTEHRVGRPFGLPVGRRRIA